MDPNLAVALITAVTTASSTAGVAITALVLNNKRFDMVEDALSTHREAAGQDRGHARRDPERP